MQVLATAAIRGRQTESVRRLVGAGAMLATSAESFVRTARAIEDEAMLSTLSDLGVDIHAEPVPTRKHAPTVTYGPAKSIAPPEEGACHALTTAARERAEKDAEAANQWVLSDDALVATVAAIAVGGDVARLGQAGFDWAAFEGRLATLRAMKVGFDGSLPIRIVHDTARDPKALKRLLDGLRADLHSLRTLAPASMSTPQRIPERLECTVPDGTSRFELAEADPAEVFMVHLQDSPFIHDELPHVGRMTQTRGLWLFGDGLTDGDLEFLPFDAMLRLTVLDLAENRLERVPPRLVGCHCLEWLSLRANPHLSEVLPELGTLSALRTLDLRQTAVTEASLASLREELPGCTVLV